MTTDSNTPIESRKKETPSSSTKMLDLQLASPSGETNIKTPLQKNTGEAKDNTQDSPNQSNKQSDVVKDTATDSLDDTFQTAADVTIRTKQSVLPMTDSKAVYHVLKVIGFHSYWIKYLIQDKKINTYKKMCEIILEQWQIYVQDQTGMDYPLLMEKDDFSRIVIFQNWCALNNHYDDATLAFKFSLEDYDKSWDQQYQLNASPTDPDLPSKSLEDSETSIDPKALDATAFQTVVGKKNSKTPKDDRGNMNNDTKIFMSPTSNASIASNKSDNSNLSNNSFHHLLHEDEVRNDNENGREDVPPDVKVELVKKETDKRRESYKDKLIKESPSRSLSLHSPSSNLKLVPNLICYKIYRHQMNNLCTKRSMKITTMDRNIMVLVFYINKIRRQYQLIPRMFSPILILLGGGIVITLRLKIKL